MPETEELWRISYGLKMVWENEKSVILESSCAGAVEHVLNPHPSFDMFDLVYWNKQLMSEYYEFRELVHVDDSTNLAVVVLANTALNAHAAFLNSVRPQLASGLF